MEGSLNKERFLAYIRDDLAPGLQAGDIVVMDNLATHKVKGVKELIAAAGATVLYLPVYSPDLNPIEAMWSKLKAYLREVKARITGDLLTAIADGLKTITADNCIGWWWHAGYAVDFKRK
jgi:transposase